MTPPPPPSSPRGDDLSNFSMTDLFRMEVEGQATTLTNGLLALEREPAAQEQLRSTMRAAHSLKGAARMIGYDAAVRVAHAMEDCLVAAQNGTITLTPAHMDVLLHGVDVLTQLASVSDAVIEGGGTDAEQATADQFVESLAQVTPASNGQEPAPISEPAVSPAPAAKPPAPVATPRPATLPPASAPASDELSDTTVRVSAEHLNRLLSLAGESLVTARWVATLTNELSRLKKMHAELVRSLSLAREHAEASHIDDTVREALRQTSAAASSVRDMLIHAAANIDDFDHRSLSVAQRMYNEVLASRMRPFADGVQGLPRMVRDIARALGKRMRFEVIGETTPVDRDILQRLEAPLLHLLRNVVDHAIEFPDERRAAGKTEEGVATLQARHSAGKLIVTLNDDGRGVDVEAIRRTVTERGLTTPEVAAQLSDAELIEFLFLPGFSTKSDVTEFSGRGVGLDAVRVAVREVGGSVDLSTTFGAGMRVQLNLPLTLSVVRALLVDIGAEPYAIPLARVTHVLRVPRMDVQSAEGREHVMLDGHPLGLVAARDVLGVPGTAPSTDELSVIVIGDRATPYGLVVDQFLGERELVVRPLDIRLGKVRDISAAALMPDGSPVLIIDADDLVRSIEVLIQGGPRALLSSQPLAPVAVRRHRVLVVDDSITVRETERKLLEAAGYEVDVAVDGMDAWNVVRNSSYDLVVTDVDMPRLDGIELTTLIRKHARLRNLPVMIVSYKDRQEDRLRGLDAGADYYLTKASFHDDTLLRAAADLIGERRGG